MSHGSNTSTLHSSRSLDVISWSNREGLEVMLTSLTWREVMLLNEHGSASDSPSKHAWNWREVEGERDCRLLRRGWPACSTWSQWLHSAKRDDFGRFLNTRAYFHQPHPRTSTHIKIPGTSFGKKGTRVCTCTWVGIRYLRLRKVCFMSRMGGLEIGKIESSVLFGFCVCFARIFLEAFGFWDFGKFSTPVIFLHIRSQNIRIAQLSNKIEYTTNEVFRVL